jgi:predicted phosphoribosyltransferase
MAMRRQARGAGFANRREAGTALAESLEQYAGRTDVLVLALPRGGVPVGHAVAHALNAPLDVFVVRKLGLPGHAELAMGAIASGGVRVMNHDVLDSVDVSQAAVDRVIRTELAELERRELAYRQGRPPAAIEGKVVILVDDGLATGSSMRAAALAVRRRHPAKVVVAVPVGARETCLELREVADEVVCAFSPEPFSAVGLWYADFTQTTDAEVRQLLARAQGPAPAPAMRRA